MTTKTASEVWRLSEENGIGILEFDIPGSEVNILKSDYLYELQEKLKSLAGRKDLKALLFTSAKKRIFIAGADINEIKDISTETTAFEKAEEGKRVFDLIEALPMTTVAVINGACLGGGLELALACDFRVASFDDQVKIGLPEVKLGILPGFGGSIRLPHLVGLVRALPLILAGKICSAKEALRYGIVERLFPHVTLKENAVAFAQEAAEKGKAPRRKPRKRTLMTRFLEDTPFGRSLVFKRARKDILKRTKGFYPAPFEIIRLIEKTYGRVNAKAYELESRHFAKLGATEVSKNLIRLFFLSERYKKYAWTGLKLKAEPVRKCGVVGAGVMGGGIAQLMSQRNIPVRVRDINEQALGGALKEARKIFEGALKRRKIGKYDLENKMGLISVGLSSAGFKSCDVIVEAIVENLEIKKKVFRELDALTAPSTILASNTSSLSVSRMAEGCRHPERIVGLHFFNPVHRMPLVEVIRGEQTSEETLEKTIQFARSIGKSVIVTGDAAGFLVNRLLLPYLNEAAYLLMEGVSPVELDAIACDFGMPMGPVTLVDQVGIDVGYKVAHVLYDAFGERMKEAGILHEVMDQGLLGKKSGKGFYLYHGKEQTVNPAVKLGAAGAGQTPREDVIKRLIYIMINEAARCLEERVVDSAATVDMGMIMGTGFPPFRAGLLAYADSLGLANVVKDLERFQKEVHPVRFEPSPYLLELARKNQTFHSS